MPSGNGEAPTQTIVFPELLPWGTPCFLIYERIIGSGFNNETTTRHGMLIGATPNPGEIPNKHRSRIHSGE